MRCATCSYPLFNLKARQCPECGTPFAPSDFEFAPNSTRFCCPDCDHPYFGTDASGHLEPRAFACLRCGRPVAMDEMIVRPGLGLDERETTGNVMPWLERRHRGRVRSWFETVGQAMAAPGRLMRAVPTDSPLGSAVLFFILTIVPIYLVGCAVPSFYGMLLGGRTGFFFGGGTTITRVLASIGFGAVALVGVMAVWILLAHGVLLVTGGARESLRRTAQAILYSSGANIVSAVPCFGSAVGWIWWATSASLMLRQGQRVHGGRAALAVFALPLIVSIGLCSMYVVAMGRSMAAAGTAAAAAAPGAPGTAHYDTYALNYSILQHAMQNGGIGPEHGLELELIQTGSGWFAGSGGFCATGTKTGPGNIPVGDRTLAVFRAGGRTDQLSKVAAAIEWLPKGVVAHRVGDFVFVHHGARLNQGIPDLWGVVMLADPDANGPPVPSDPVCIGTTDYRVTTTTFAELAAKTEVQNALRASNGLPPLPDLATVTHGNPGVSPPNKSAEPPR